MGFVVVFLVACTRFYSLICRSACRHVCHVHPQMPQRPLPTGTLKEWPIAQPCTRQPCSLASSSPSPMICLSNGSIWTIFGNKISRDWNLITDKITRPSSIYFSLGIVRDIVPLVIYLDVSLALPLALSLDLSHDNIMTQYYDEWRITPLSKLGELGSEQVCECFMNYLGRVWAFR